MSMLNLAPKEKDYCKKCLTLTGTLEGLSAACSKKGIPHWTSIHELRFSAKVCKLCALVLKAGEYYLDEVQGRGLCFRDKIQGPLNVLLQKQEILHAPEEQNLDDSLPLSVNTLSRLLVKDSTPVEPLEVVCLYVTANEVVNQTVTVDVHGDLARRQARTWLSECCMTHTHCVTESNKPLPSRLLDLSADRQDSSIRLTSTEGQRGSYIALSYCWGGSDQPYTSKENINRRLDLTSLPKTIQDAVMVSRSLGMRYLWVDALCIVQDDEEDRRTQIMSMGMVYKNAVLTIAASASRSVHEGFLQTRHSPAPDVTLPMYLSSTQRGEVNISRLQPHWLPSEPIYHRGWTFQEFVLSKRLLLYGEYEMLWSCSTHQLVPVRKSHMKYLSHGLDGNGFKILSQLFSLADPSPSRSETQQTEAWGALLRNYSGRTTSSSVDKINALAGIVTELASIWNDTYFMGVWRRVLAQTLAWRRSSVEYQNKRLLEGVPTWSWVSISCGVNLVEEMEYPDAKLVSHTCPAESIVTLHHMSSWSGALTLRAKVDAVSALKQKPGPYLNKVIPDFNPSSRSRPPKHTFIALLGYSRSSHLEATAGLSLILQATGASTFERIGFMEDYFDWTTVEYSNIILI